MTSLYFHLPKNNLFYKSRVVYFVSCKFIIVKNTSLQLKRNTKVMIRPRQDFRRNDKLQKIQIRENPHFA